jgi:hypothetical protein
MGSLRHRDSHVDGQCEQLKELEDFNGNYTVATAEETLAGGAGGITMENQKGVVFDLVATTHCGNLKLALSGLKIMLQKSCWRGGALQTPVGPGSQQPGSPYGDRQGLHGRVQRHPA